LSDKIKVLADYYTPLASTQALRSRQDRRGPDRQASDFRDGWRSISPSGLLEGKPGGILTSGRSSRWSNKDSVKALDMSNGRSRRLRSSRRSRVD